MGIDETLLSEVVRRVLTVVRPDKIILFGSAATGQMTKDSDIDLLIVEPAPKNRHQESVAIADAIGDVNFPVDVKIIAAGAVRGHQEHHRRHRLSGPQVRESPL